MKDKTQEAKVLRAWLEITKIQGELKLTKSERWKGWDKDPGLANEDKELQPKIYFDKRRFTDDLIYKGA